MTRRSFLKKLVDGFKIVTLSGLLPRLLLTEATAIGGGEKVFYESFKGLSLKEIALKKMHHGNGRYVNPFSNATHGNLLRVLKWKLLAENHFKNHYADEQVVPVSVDWAKILRHRGLSITFLKHACVMIKDIDQYLLVDPVFFGLFWFLKDFSPLAFNIGEMPRPHHILITHGHYDHLDKRSLAILDKNTHLITPLGYDGIFRDLGTTRRTQLDWFDSYSQDGQEIMLLPCNHWTMRNPISGPNRSLWGSYLVKTASGFTLFVGGDAAYFEGFRELGKEFSIDLAIFNLGAYEPRWFMASSHMNPSDTVQAFKDLRAKHLLIVHWGTFRLGDEPVHFPPRQIRQELEKEGLIERLVHLRHGETLIYDRYLTSIKNRQRTPGMSPGLNA